MSDGIIASMNLSSLGEFGLIGLIKDAVDSIPSASSPDSTGLVIGIGDDTAAWRASALLQLATIDALVEDVHFSFKWCTWEDLGYKSLAVNLSDIAAMAGQPRYALVALSCPGSVEVEDIMAYYRGMASLAQQHRVAIVGGNLTSSPVVTSTVTVIGEAEAEQLMTRHSAQPGDAIAVTGTLGGAAAALKLLEGAESRAQDCSTALRQSLLRPTPRLAEARILAAGGIRCGIDISDGLLGDLGHICESSHVSATVYGARVPVSRLIPDQEERLTFALTGGEDYELLFTGDIATIEHTAQSLQCGVSIIGEINSRSEKPAISVLDERGRPIAPKRAGWGHFQA